MIQSHRLNSNGFQPRQRIACRGFLFLSLLMACSEEKTVEFPDGLEPLEEIRVAPPIGTSSQPFPEEINWISGETDDYGWVHARGYLAVSPEEAWAKLREPTVFVDVDKVSEYSVEKIPSSDYDYVYVVSNKVEDIVDVEFDVEWRHGLVDGEPQSPALIGVRWQKISGTEFIDSLEGSVLILSVKNESQITEVQIIEHLSALQDQEDNAVDFVTGLYERWRNYP